MLGSGWDGRSWGDKPPGLRTPYLAAIEPLSEARMNLLLPLHTPSGSFLKPVAWALAALTAASLACNMPTTSGGGPTPADSEFPETDSIYDEAGMSMAEALAVAPEDDRPGVLAQLGPPDVFTVEWQLLEGQVVRYEEWSYFDFQSRMDFVDGELLWTLDIDPASDGSIYAHAFDPLAFEAGMSIAEVETLLPDLEFSEFPLEEADIPGGRLMAADQIMLGFDQGELVFVQTYLLAPDDPELFSQEEPTQPPTAEATEPPVGPTMPEGVLLLDSFDDPNHSASPLFASEYMAFAADGGSGIMTAHNAGMLAATYASPSVADFHASLTMQWIDPRKGSGAGFIFRSDDAAGGLAHFYLVLVQPADGYVALKRFHDGQLVEVEGTPLLILTEAPGAPITLSVTASGQTFTVDVNQIPTLVVQDDGLVDPGIVGLAMVSPHDGDQVRFDELRMEALDE